MKTATRISTFLAASSMLALGAVGTVSAEPKGTLNYATMIQLNNWNPLIKTGQTYTAIPYEGLLQVADDGFTLEPRLATEWELTPTELKLKLREGVIFHDGEPFNAEAVKANLDWIRGSGTQWATGLNVISEIVIDGPYEITLKLSSPTPTMADRLATRGYYMVSPKHIATENWDIPVGTGPWTYDAEASQFQTKEVFKLFDGYWNLDAVGVDSIVMHVMQEPGVALNSLKAGMVQVAEMITSQVKAAEAEGFGIKATPTLVQHFLMLDRKTTFADENVRKALCHAIDVEAIGQGAFDGFAEPVSQRFLEGQYGYNPAVKGYTYDVEAAKKYLAAAGNPEISLTLPMYPQTQTAMTLIAQMLREAGFSPETQMMTTGQYFSYYQSDRYPLQINTSATESIGPLDYYQFRFGPNGVGNPFKVEVPELDAIVERALAEPDRAKQEVIWQEMIQYIEDHALDCNFYLWKTVWAYDESKVEGVESTVMRPSALRYDEMRLKN